jgi:acyl-coenzyme A thioesterase PaaI-like protein
MRAQEGAFLSSPSDEFGFDAALQARRRLAREIRSLMTAAVLTRTDEDTISAAAALVRKATGDLSASRRAGRYDGITGLAPRAATNDLIWETHGAFGHSNPLAPPAVVDEGDGRLSGSVTFDGAWEGGPGTVYGGFIAAVFDGMMGRAVLSAGHLGVTRSLTVRYLRPTPLHRALRIESEAGPKTGRQVAVQSRLWDGDLLTCEAEAVFTCVDPSRYQA